VWVDSLNSAACGPWWNKQVNLELFEGPHSPAGKKHLFKKCNDGSGHYHLDGDEIISFGKTKSDEQKKDLVVDIGDWIRWFGVFVQLKSGLFKVFRFRLTTTTDKGGFIQPRMQGCTIVAFAKKWDYKKAELVPMKKDDKICGLKLIVDDYITTMPNAYDGIDEDQNIHLRHQNLTKKERGDQIIIDIRFCEKQGMLYPNKNSYKLFKQIIAILLNAPTELGGKAVDIYLPSDLFEKFWGEDAGDQIMLTLNSEYQLAKTRRGRKLQRCKLINVCWMSEIGAELKSSGLIKTLNDRFVMTEDEWNFKIDGWY
jgi:hypothetical protein